MGLTETMRSRLLAAANPLPLVFNHPYPKSGPNKADMLHVGGMFAVAESIVAGGPGGNGYTGTSNNQTRGWRGRTRPLMAVR